MSIRTGTAGAVAWALAAALLTGTLAARGEEAHQIHPRTGVVGAHTWFLTSADQLRPGAPPGDRGNESDLRRLMRLERNRSKRQERLARKWEQAATLPWTKLILRMIVIHRPPAFPTRSARALALLHLGMQDAVTAAIEAREHFRRKRPYTLDPELDPLFRSPGPGYPDLVAAVAGAAETILPYLFPQEAPRTFQALATEAARSRLWAGVSFPSDVAAGRTLGRQVGQAAIAYGEADGHKSPAAPILAGRLCDPSDCQDPDQYHWVPTLPYYQFPPSDPAASQWKTYLVDRPDQFLPPPPPAYGSQPFMDQLAELKAANDAADPTQRELAFFWDDGPGTFSPAGHWNDIAADAARARHLTTIQTSTLFGLMNAAIVDAFISVWKAKYTYWSIRPVSVIAERPTILGASNPLYDPGWVPNIITPAFPAYPSGHSGESAAAARVLQYFLSGTKQDVAGLMDAIGAVGSYDLLAEEVARSRMIGGIHIRADNEQGLILGRRVAGVAIALAQANGWTPFKRRSARSPASVVPPG